MGRCSGRKRLVLPDRIRDQRNSSVHKDQIVGHAVTDSSRLYTNVPQPPLLEAINALPVIDGWAMRRGCSIHWHGRASSPKAPASGTILSRHRLDLVEAG
jgi:hypothetical protein